MSGVRERIPKQALERHDRGELKPSRGGPVLLGLGKEVLLTRLTTLRSRDHHAAIDYIFEEAKRRNAFVFTTTHVVAEVLGTVRSGKDSNTVESLWDDLSESHISVLYDGEPWDEDSSSEQPTSAGFRPPKAQFRNVHRLYAEQSDLDFKFHEGTLLLNTVSLEERLDAESATVCLVTFDGALWALGSRYGLEVLPYNTPLRADEKYR